MTLVKFISLYALCVFFSFRFVPALIESIIFLSSLRESKSISCTWRYWARPPFCLSKHNDTLTTLKQLGAEQVVGRSGFGTGSNGMVVG